MGLQLVLPMLYLRRVKGAHLKAPLAIAPFNLAELQAARWHA
jgi:hypothetical protein